MATIQQRVLDCLSAPKYRLTLHPTGPSVDEMIKRLVLTENQIRGAIGGLRRNGHNIVNEPKRSGRFVLWPDM